jgi:anti-anti-sigma regulatory factor
VKAVDKPAPMMPTARGKAAAAPTVALTSNCTVKDSAALKQSLSALLESNEPVTLDATSVERVDTAILQLLCAFVQARAALNRGIVWRGEGAVVADSARLLGLHALLALPEDTAGAAA